MALLNSGKPVFKCGDARSILKAVTDAEKAADSIFPASLNKYDERGVSGKNDEVMMISFQPRRKLWGNLQTKSLTRGSRLQDLRPAHLNSIRHNRKW